MFELKNFNSIKIGLASPEKIREWSHGEVTRPETINYRTLKPEVNGLFCERIFGPRKDYECHCGKYKRVRYKGHHCEKCGVEITRSKVRRERMGHIELATPVSHIWYVRGVPSRIGTILDMTAKNLEQVLYYVCYIVLDPGKSNFEYKQIITDKEYRDALEEFGADGFRAGMGAEAIRELLADIDLKQESKELKETVLTAKGAKKLKAVKKLETVESFLKSGNHPRWMILDCLPVLPPDLRPMIQLDGGRFAASDLNDLYRRVINRNNRLKKLIDLGAPDVIVRNEKRMLQEAVDALIANGKRGKPVQGAKQRELKSLTAMISGKQGRFRQNLLGKRVDYSGRSVIVVGPELKIYQCGLPKEMALELFKPFVMRKLVELNFTQNVKSAKRMVERERPEVWDILEDVIKDHPVILDRAPTLHRLSLQAFEPVLVEGRAIKLHPLVCPGFNADFDGDTMAIHVPLSIAARTEARILMLASNNILRPATGVSAIEPNQDMILGAYYMTVEYPDAKGAGTRFVDEDEAKSAYLNRLVDIHAPIEVRRETILHGQHIQKRVKTTIGRILFNECIPQILGYVDRENPETCLNYEVDFPMTVSLLKGLISKTFDLLGSTKTAKMLDEVKAFGYKHATTSGITINVYDMLIPEARQKYIDEYTKLTQNNEKLYGRGLITREEKVNKNIELWNEATAKIKASVMENLPSTNHIAMMVKSKARGSADQVNQLGGIRGIIANSSGERIDIPVISNYRTGLSTFEYFMSARGGRKGLADTALKTADSGYMTRRLVDIAHGVIVSEDDCFASLGESPKGVDITELKMGDTVVETLAGRISGRVAVSDIIDPATGEVLVKGNEMITPKMANIIQESGIKSVKIRSVLTCKAKHGICAKCYGRDLTGTDMVEIGEAVGVIAAQSIGEPGTQLTMRTFHTGGVASVSDITQGLPRVEEVFEARRPNGAAVVCEVGGKVSVATIDNRKCVTIHSNEGDVEYLLPAHSLIKVKDGDVVESGTPLTEGSIYPQDILRTRGIKDVQDYILTEVYSVYKSQGVDIDPKHIEVIIRQMLRRVKVESSGDTDLIPGEIIDADELDEINLKAMSEGRMPANARRILQGLTKSSLSTNSFLSAASFQESSRVLTDAAIRGKVDHLTGLKENVIIGKLIPAGTGLTQYNTVVPNIFESVKEQSEQVFEAEYPDAQLNEQADMQTIESAQIAANEQKTTDDEMAEFDAENI
ncbi:MAG: DNA-directed RNA polymerase subunit beta' [Clostridia bacterium]|nr:DNA-directed RNA polymerase subunit beta' [Clostridia bacterium]